MLLNYEDSMESTLIPRLEAAGARADLVCDFWGKTAEGLARPPIFPDDCDLLAETIEESGAVLVVIDPFLAYVAVGLGGPLIARVLDRLARVAADTGAVILLVRHLVKWGRGLRALYRGCGGIAIPGKARTMLLAGRHPQEEGVCLLASPKNNLGPPGSTLSYRVGSSPGGQAIIDWLGPAPETADELVIAAPRERGPPAEALAEALTLLQDVLGQGPATRETVLRLAHAASITERTLRRAKSELGVVSEERREDGRNLWYWSLPEDQDSKRIMEKFFGPEA